MTWTTAGSLRGPAGADGTNGTNGLDGAPGAPGAPGVDGLAGRGISTAAIQPDGTLLLTFSDNTTQNVGLVKGLDGTNGTNGVDGKDGKSVTITGSVANAAALPTNLGPGDAGMGYITEDDGHLHVWGGTTFTDVGTVRGPAGPAGTNGTDGAAGQAGATGQRGTAWYPGHGAPAATVSPGQLPGDLYLDLDSGLVYVLS